jgi:hypothetical protein
MNFIWYVQFTVFYVVVAQMMMLEYVLALQDYLLLRDCDQGHHGSSNATQ